jgi:hypothetical protein
MSSGLYTQPQFPPPQQPAPPFGPAQLGPATNVPARTSGSGKFWLGLLMIGGGLALLFSVLVVAAVWYAVSSLEGMLLNVGREGMVAMVQESDIPEQEKTEVIAQVDRVVAAYKSGEIDQADLDRLMTGLDDSPVMAYIAWYGAEDFYLEECELPAADEALLRESFRRALYGVSYGKLDPESVFLTLPDDEQFDRNLSDAPEKAAAMVRDSAVKIDKLCDEAGVPMNPPSIDIGDEAKKLVDELLTKN